MHLADSSVPDLRRWGTGSWLGCTRAEEPDGSTGDAGKAQVWVRAQPDLRNYLGSGTEEEREGGKRVKSTGIIVPSPDIGRGPAELSNVSIRGRDERINNMSRGAWGRRWPCPSRLNAYGPLDARPGARNILGCNARNGEMQHAASLARPRRPRETLIFVEGG